MGALALNPSEVLGFILCVPILVYVAFHRKILLRGKYAFITFGFLCLAASFFFTNLEEFFLDDVINIVEHSLSASAAFFVALGCRRILLDSRGDKEPGA